MTTVIYLAKRWTFSPYPSRLLQPKYRLLVHLYSGRRRFGDIHAWMQHFVSDNPAFIVVSIDTAVDARMNVTHDSIWNMLISAGREGFIHGLILGPPCEMWSAARHEPVPNRRAPRPIRLAEAPWGCFDIFLTHHELSQLTVGSLLLLRGLWLAIVVGLTGGGVILEHPAESPFPDRASIWRTAVFKMLLRFFPGFYKVTFEQWPFGSAGVKPTTLLCANVHVPRWLEAHRDATRVRPSQALIGRIAIGEYHTTAAKEYPLQLCRALAQAICAHQGAFGAELPVPSWMALAQEFADLSASSENGNILPDYQPTDWKPTGYHTSSSLMTGKWSDSCYAWFKIILNARASRNA